MRTIQLEKLNKTVREFLGQALSGDGLIVKDKTGKRRGAIYPDETYSLTDQQAALIRLRNLQQQTRRAMDSQGVTEKDIYRLLRQDA